MASWLQQLKSNNQLLEGRYALQQEVGEGTFGVTFTAIDTHKPSQPTVIVKQLKQVGIDHNFDIAKALFEKEAAVLDKLGELHNQIPRLLAYFSNTEGFF
ncbi:MAG: serine/threonine protein kinase [Synechococcaceae cyanobacterium RL_1_2]|nr:serine/threonine protein kinase [Synechococcaceae cyanobacterium RL_1_2]